MTFASSKLPLAALGTTSLLMVFAATAVRADTVTNFPENGGDLVGPFDDITDILEEFEINDPAFETTVSTLFVPGSPGMPTDLTFFLEQDTGAFLFSFGFFDASAVSGIDPVASRQQFVTTALDSATLVFDDRTSNPTDTFTTTIDAGTELGFFIIPNNTLNGFLAGTGSQRAPLFTISDANPGEFDQALSFIGNGNTLFAFEDLTRAGFSDEDFSDLIFSVDTALVIPEPSIMLGTLVAGGFGWLAKKKRQ